MARARTATARARSLAAKKGWETRRKRIAEEEAKRKKRAAYRKSKKTSTNRAKPRLTVSQSPPKKRKSKGWVQEHREFEAKRKKATSRLRREILRKELDDLFAHPPLDGRGSHWRDDYQAGWELGFQDADELWLRIEGSMRDVLQENPLVRWISLGLYYHLPKHLGHTSWGDETEGSYAVFWTYPAFIEGAQHAFLAIRDTAARLLWMGGVIEFLALRVSTSDERPPYYRTRGVREREEAKARRPWKRW